MDCIWYDQWVFNNVPSLPWPQIRWIWGWTMTPLGYCMWYGTLRCTLGRVASETDPQTRLTFSPRFARLILPLQAGNLQPLLFVFLPKDTMLVSQSFVFASQPAWHVSVTNCWLPSVTHAWSKSATVLRFATKEGDMEIGPTRPQGIRGEAWNWKQMRSRDKVKLVVLNEHNIITDAW